MLWLINLGYTASASDAPTPEPAPEATQKPAGRKRRRLVVEIDGRDFQVSSADEAIALLQRAKEFAVAQIEQSRAKPATVRPGIQRPRIKTAAPELRQAVQQARQEITSLYDAAIRDFEIAALLAKADEEEEEALIRLLM